MNTDIRQYLAPLTNNERGTLMWAAGLTGYRWYPERTTSVEVEIERYPRSKRIPDGQRDKAILGLVEKGYATITPKRGNYWFRHRGWSGLYANGAPIHKVFVEKQNGNHPNVPWYEIVDITPTADVKAMLATYRAEQEAAEKAEADRRRAKVPTMQAERERRVLDLAKRLVERYDGTDEPMIKKHDNENYDWYVTGDVIDELSDAIKTLERWTNERRRIEQA